MQPGTDGKTPSVPVAPSPVDSIHKHAFWIYGVIVGLAIKEAMSDTLPELFKSASLNTWSKFAVAAKLALFLMMTIRFYLGSAHFFDSAHCGPKASELENKSYSIDFIFGAFHFLIFSVWAMSLADGMPDTLFLNLMWVILGFDVIWYFFCRSFDTRHLMKLWMVFNLTTLLVSALTYLFFLQWFSRFTAELLALIPVLIASVIDIRELITGKNIVKGWFANLITMHPAKPKPQA